MKKSLLIFSGLVILGISLIISTLILSNSLSSQNHIINGSFGVNQSVTSSDSGARYNEYMAIGEVSSLLGYDNIETFTEDVLDDKLGDLPYINVEGKLIFSRTAFDEWLVNTARQKGK